MNRKPACLLAGLRQKAGRLRWPPRSARFNEGQSFTPSIEYNRARLAGPPAQGDDAAECTMRRRLRGKQWPACIAAYARAGIAAGGARDWPGPIVRCRPASSRMCQGVAAGIE